MYWVSAKEVWIPLYISLLYVAWRNYSWKGALTLLIMAGLCMLVTDWANSHFLRPWIGRLRPNNPDNPLSSIVHVVRGRYGSGCGFPSAHAGNIWALTFLIIHWFRDRLLSMAMVILAILVCYSRSYMAFHYPGDLLGGMALAWITVFIATWIHQEKLHFVNVKEPKHTWVPVVVMLLTLGAFAMMSIMENVVMAGAMG